MYKAQCISPMIPSYNIRKTISFFIELLDFQMERDDTTYVILCKDNATLHIQRAGIDIGEMSFYIVVDNIEKVWEKLKTKTEHIKIKQPFDQEYGMREIHVIIPETKTLMFIGQKLN